MHMFEYVKRVPGHKNSKGESAPWTIVSHETGKIISSHKTKKAAEEHLKWMDIYSRKSKYKKKSKMESMMEEQGMDQTMGDENALEVSEELKNMDKKYELTDETMEFDGPDPHILHRIRALKDFTLNAFGGDVKAGDLGGWIESEDNLSQKGKCWVSKNAKVYGGAKVYEDAIVTDRALVFDNAKVYGGAVIYEDAEIFDDAKVHGTVHVYGGRERYNDYDELQYFKTLVHGNADICAGVVGRGETVTEIKHPYGISIKLIDPMDEDFTEDDNLFAESISQLGLSKPQMEAIMRIHDIAYGKTLQEGRISNALGAGALAAMMATSPANAQNPSEYYDSGAEVTSIEEPDALPYEQIQDINKKMADKYLDGINSLKPWDEVNTGVNTGDYKYTIRPIEEIDAAAGKIRENMRMLLDMNIDIDEQLKEKDIEHLDNSLEEWKRDLLENMNSLVGWSADTVEYLNTFGIGYADDPEKADEIAIKDAIKTFKDRGSIPHGYKLVVYPDFARKIIHLPDGIGEGYVKYVTGVVVHTVPDSEYLDVPEYLRVGNISELPTTR